MSLVPGRTVDRMLPGEPGKPEAAFLKGSEGVLMSDIPYPDTPQPDIPAPPQPDWSTPVPETEPEPEEEPALLPPQPSESPGEDVPKVG